MKRNKDNILGEGNKKILPVKFENQEEIKVNYAIAKFRDKGIAFKSNQGVVNFNNNARCWIKIGDTVGRKEFHLTLRFEGVDYLTNQGKDCFDIDLYLPLEEFINNFNLLKIDNTFKLRFNDNLNKQEDKHGKDKGSSTGL